MINLSVLLITQFQILKKNFKALLIISFLLGLNIVYSQNNSQKLDSLDINKEEKKPLLLDNIKYDATDSIIIDQKNNKIILYNNAKILYEDIELTAGLIILDYKENIVNAGNKINIDYHINDILEEEQQKEIFDYFINEADNDSIEEAEKYFEENTKNKKFV